jgi:hypothetical protein
MCEPPPGASSTKNSGSDGNTKEWNHILKHLAKLYRSKRKEWTAGWATSLKNHRVVLDETSAALLQA